MVNSVPLSVCKRIGHHPDLKMTRNAYFKVFPVLSFNGTTHAYRDNTSIHVNKYFNPLLKEDNFAGSTKSACHWWSILLTTTRLLGNRRLVGLCKVYASSNCNHSLTCFFVPTFRLKFTQPSIAGGR